MSQRLERSDIGKIWFGMSERVVSNGVDNYVGGEEPEQWQGQDIQDIPPAKLDGETIVFWRERGRAMKSSHGEGR